MEFISTECQYHSHCLGHHHADGWTTATVSGTLSMRFFFFGFVLFRVFLRKSIVAARAEIYAAIATDSSSSGNVPYNDGHLDVAQFHRFCHKKVSF